MLPAATMFVVASLTLSAAPLRSCKALDSEEVSATLTRIPDGSMAFGAGGYLAWVWPSALFQHIGTSGRRTISYVTSEDGEGPFFPLFIRGSDSGRIVWSEPGGLFLERDGEKQQLGGSHAITPVIRGDAVYYSENDAVHVVDRESDGVVFGPASLPKGAHGFPLRRPRFHVGGEIRTDACMAAARIDIKLKNARARWVFVVVATQLGLR